MNPPNTLTENEKNFLRHISMWGSDGYPVRKSKSGWVWAEMFSIKGAPVVYKTKKAAHKAIQGYIDILCDKKAGRI